MKKIMCCLCLMILFIGNSFVMRADARILLEQINNNLPDHSYFQEREIPLKWNGKELKVVYLTFDDGPSSNVTPMVLDTLKAENIKATFFLLGSRVELSPEIVKREFDEGHYLASHGYSHVYSQIYASPQSVLDEYNNCITAIRNAIGMPDYNPHLFRFPGGYWGGKYASIKTEALTLLNENNIAHIDWNALTSDAAGAKTTEEFIAELDKTVPKHNSVVVLMHDAGGKKATAEALPTIISYFRNQGFEFDNFYSIIK